MRAPCRAAALLRYTCRVLRILSPAEFRAQPWKNGGGVTYEIARWPDAAAADYDLRISIADDRQPGPFSTFPGYRRWSFLAAAAPITLDVAGNGNGNGNGNDAPPRRHHLTELGQLLEVDGETPITCELPAGPTRLFNILVRRGVAAEIGRGPTEAPIRFAFALTDLPWLPAGHAAFFDPPEAAALNEHTPWLR